MGTWLRNMLTVFPVVQNLQLTLFRSQQCLCQLCSGVMGGVRPSKEVAGAGALHHLHPGVAEHLTEAVIAVDDGTVLHLRIGNEKLAIWGK